MRRIYIGGPLTPRLIHDKNYAIDYLMNARNMIAAGIDLLLAGFAPYIPALDLLIFLCTPQHAKITEEIIKNQAIQWLLACDAMLVVEGWETSTGTLAEMEIAKANNIPVFTSLDALKGYFEEQN